MGVRVLSLGKRVLGFRSSYCLPVAFYRSDGGAGALSELLILERMMYRTKVEGPLDRVPSPCDCFDLIGGSGTGGILALMLGRMRMSIADTIAAYKELRPQNKIGFAEKFQASTFEEVLKKRFGQEMMEDVGDDVCKTFVCAMNKMNMNAGIPEIFRTYGTPEESASDCMIWEAARATSATPGLFKAKEIRRNGITQLYIGGGLVHNNPTSLVLAEAGKMYPSRPVVLVMSIGSGHPDTIQFRSGAIAKTLMSIATDCEKTHEDSARRFRASPDTYFRLNVQQGMQTLAPQDWDKLSEVSSHSRAYLDTEEAKSKLAGAVSVILSKGVGMAIFAIELIIFPDPVIPVSESPVYLKACPGPSARFTGREAILRQMTEYFNTGVGRRHIFVLHGLGGAGKSQLAFKFVEESAMPEPRSVIRELCHAES
ncbi:FabD lysophospholipase-like protein [Mycena rosella]|uniref:FabD lysophospholipase-like protein n=1 Tax=Mycena rosella TaxID=1033263 RepID=A0AAD7G623_MYCRO|nr:FabD lysophospholipase-like protein [Mycena rosella]